MLGHHLHEITIAQAVSDVPSHAQNDNLSVKLAVQVNRVSGSGLVTWSSHRQEPSLLDYRRCTRTSMPRDPELPIAGSQLSRLLIEIKSSRSKCDVEVKCRLNRLGKVVGKVVLFAVIPNASKDSPAVAMLFALVSMIWLSDGSAGCRSNASETTCTVNAVCKPYMTGFLIFSVIALFL